MTTQEMDEIKKWITCNGLKDSVRNRLGETIMYIENASKKVSSKEEFEKCIRCAQSQMDDVIALWNEYNKYRP